MKRTIYFLLSLITIGCVEPPEPSDSDVKRAESEADLMLTRIGLEHGAVACRNAVYQIECQSISKGQLLNLSCRWSSNSGLQPCRVQEPEKCVNDGPRFGVALDSKGGLNPTVTF